LLLLAERTIDSIFRESISVFEQRGEDEKEGKRVVMCHEKCYCHFDKLHSCYTMILFAEPFGVKIIYGHKKVRFCLIFCLCLMIKFFGCEEN
jgi:hypothetical protein